MAYFWIGEEKNGRNKDNGKESTLIPMHSSMVMGGEDHRIVSISPYLILGTDVYLLLTGKKGGVKEKSQVQ